MELSAEHIDELIAKVIVLEASAAEKALLEQWTESSAANASYFEQSKKLFRTIDSFQSEEKLDVDAAWHKLDERITTKDTKIIPLFKRHALLKAAASIVLLLTLGFVISLLLQDNTVKPIQIAVGTKALEQVLPDGSKVMLNKNSELAYVETKDHKRKVNLKGEAYFEVKHNAEEPFVIEVEGVMIEDIGTAFNVKALPGSNIVEVLVEEGEVRFYTAANTGLSLHKGEKAIYDLNNKNFVKSIPDAFENTASYKSKVFHFNETNLNEVLNQLNAVYDLNIHLSDSMAGNCRLSVAFTNENPDLIVSVIAETLNMKVERDAKGILLKGSACNNN